MRRSLVALATIALAGSMLAFAPAVSSQQAETDHEIVFTEDGSQTVQGAETNAGINPGFPAPEGCTKDPNTYCETIHVTVEQPVADTDPDVIEFGTGEVAFSLAPATPGPDFDVTVFESDASGTQRGDVVADSGNFPACSVVCESPAGAVVGEGCGPDHDECGSWAVSTSDAVGTRYYVIEVYYYIAAGPYTLDVSYVRTDGAGGEPSGDGTGTDGTDDGSGATTGAPADSAERLDVTGGFEKVGDWGGGGNNAALGDALGQDFEAAFIEYADDTFTFTLDMTSLLPAGGTPEFTRYGWSFRYNDLELELDGKFTNFSRGACDPTAGSCPPPRNPGVGTFLLRGDCVEDTTLPMTLTLCQEFANVQATFDPADGTITIPIPAAALAPDGVQACDEIVGIPSFIGNSIWSAPSAFITNTAMPYDDALHWIPFVVPPADPAVTC